MRWSTDPARDETRAIATCRAALDAGIRVFDTARAYALDESELGHNERLLARALGDAEAFVVTKGGMGRPQGRWVPDGRAQRLEEDCAASREALGGRPIDLYLLHAPDPRTPIATSVRALLALKERGWVRGVGLSNVNRTQLAEALALGPLDGIEIALGAGSDEAARGGVLALARERELLVLAHSPFGGPVRAARLRREDPELPGRLLAWLVELGTTPIPGASRPENANTVGRLPALGEAERTALAARFPGLAPRRASTAVIGDDGEVVLIMGIPGAGKSTAVAEWVARGYERLNRDERGGSLKALHARLAERLGAGTRRLVLDNTYTSRAFRSDVLGVAAAHGVPVRCLFLDTPLPTAQANVVRRILDRAGRLPEPDELRRSKDPAILAPRVLHRHLRELEPPSPDEGFASIDVVPFTRHPGTGVPGVFVTADDLEADLARALPHAPPGQPLLLFAWRPDDALDALSRTVTDRPVGAATCPHGAGPPICWCRPPLPGLPLVLARAHGVDPTRSILIGKSAVHRTLAAAIGAEFVHVSPT
jgi:aryl-alcohol dehydrogenase-like predicted oxidoreductase/adenylate kinase family enzyme